MLMAQHNGIIINKGDDITIKARGLTVTGKVHSVNWFEDAGWYIEIEEANVPGGYSYWKQHYDGGHVVSVNGGEC